MAEGKEILSKVKNIKKSLEQARFDLDSAYSSGDYTRAAELKYDAIPKLEKELIELESKHEKENKMLIMK